MSEITDTVTLLDEPTAQETNAEPAQETNAEPAQEQKVETPPVRSVAVDVDGKQYNVSEDLLKKYWGIPLDAKITDNEFKTMLSSYKQAIHFNNSTREVKNKEDAINKFVQDLEVDPKNALKKLYATKNDVLIKAAEDILMEHLELEMLDPREKEIRARQQENERIREEYEQQKKLLQEQELARLQEQYTNQIQSEIINELDKSELPKTEHTVKRIAQYLLAGQERGMNLKVSQVIPLVLEDYQTELKAMFGTANPEKIMSLLGDEKMAAIRKADIAKVKNIQSSKQSNNGSQNSIGSKKIERKESMTPDEFKEYMKKKAMEGFDKFIK